MQAANIEYAFSDITSSLISLQLLQQIGPLDQPPSEISPPPNNPIADVQQYRSVPLPTTQQYAAVPPLNSRHQDYPVQQNVGIDGLGKGQKLGMKGEDDYSEGEVELKLSNVFSKRTSFETEHQEHLHQPTNQATISEDAQQIKHNFEALFQKVYGIIEEMQQRNQQTDCIKEPKTILKSSSKKELVISTRVIELSVGKANDKLRRKRFGPMQTQLQYENQHTDHNSEINPKIKTESEMYSRTPYASSGRTKSTNLLSLTKQFPYLASPKATQDSARSDRSRSKGLSLVSSQKNQQMKGTKMDKKPVKITIIQKKIELPQRKQAQAENTNGRKKVQKKISSFNPASYFSSRRVSTNRVF